MGIDVSTRSTYEPGLTTREERAALTEAGFKLMLAALKSNPCEAWQHPASRTLIRLWGNGTTTVASGSVVTIARFAEILRHKLTT